MTNMTLDEDLLILKDLDFDVSCNHAKLGCENKATWLFTLLCCKKEFYSCEHHREMLLKVMRDSTTCYCQSCSFGWDPKKIANIDWVKL